VDPEQPLEELAGAVLDGTQVDWDLAGSRTTDESQASRLRGLRRLDRIVKYSRSAQRRLDAGQPEPWGHLTILERAGAGSSGEIWRAWDARLHRDVALKFLFVATESGQEDSALLEEARALARVRHPGVVAVHGIDEHDGRLGMWMELLTGDTLDAEIERRGPLPAREVAEIGLELCRALEAIENAGLVHRDIKPANISREPDGRIVLMDFGLGQRRAIPEWDPSRSSGTPIFMSPERLAGGPATARSDLYALGVTLRWALTGHCPFRARTIDELKVEAAASPSVALRSERRDAPALLIAAIDRAMAPRPDDRFVDAPAMAESLRQVLREERRRAELGKRATLLAPLAAAALVVAAVVLLVSRFMERPAPHPAARFAVTAPEGTRIPVNRVDLALSPDGRMLVFAAQDSSGIQRLWLRPLESLTARALEGTDGGVTPFWSPDSRFIGFFGHMKLQKISPFGGPPEALCRAPDARGGTWGKDGVIVFAPEVTGPLCRVSAEGGAVTEIQRPDAARGETALRWPRFLPDGRRFFFVSLPPRDSGFDVYVASVDSKERRRVMSAGCAPVPAGRNGILFASNGRLMYQRFDYRTLKPEGTAVALGPAPFSDSSVGEPLAFASDNGVLAHLDVPLTNTRVRWLDRSGRPIEEVPLPVGRYEAFHFAPDGKKVLAERRDSPTTVNLWLVDLERKEARPFSQGSQTRLGGKPVWSPDGKQVAFNSNRSGRTYIYRRFVSETAEEQLLYQSPGQFNEVESWSSDGRYLVFQQAGLETGWDIWLLPLEGKHEPVPYLRTRFNEYTPSISPDGKWLAYATDTETYVRSFPEPGVEHLVLGDPAWPFWSTNGRELLLYNGGVIRSVPVTTVPTFRAGKPQVLFPVPPGDLSVMGTPAGDRFLESTPVSDEASVAVDVNFLVPTDR